MSEETETLPPYMEGVITALGKRQDHDSILAATLITSLRTRLETAERELATIKGSPFEKEREELVGFLKVNFPDLVSVEAWPVSRAVFQLRKMAGELTQLQQANAELVKEFGESRLACKLGHSALDDLMGDSDLENDESSEMKACQALARVIAKGTV